jgi:hypothetical protein
MLFPAVCSFSKSPTDGLNTVCDSRGFWLCQRRLSTGRFRFWPESTSEAAKVLEAHELQVLLAGGDPGATQAVPAWRRIA